MSTEMALLQFVNKISKDMDDKSYTIGIFLDLSKAFDTFNYNIILTKLKKKYGIQGCALKWIKNNLHERNQFVFVNHQSSKRGKLKRGVPQGSILGPLSFIVYIND